MPTHRSFLHCKKVFNLSPDVLFCHSIPDRQQRQKCTKANGKGFFVLESDKKMKLLIVLTGLIAFAAAHHSLSDEVSRENNFSM